MPISRKMKTVCVQAVLALASAPVSSETAFRHVAVVDVRDGAVRKDQTVLIDGDRIREIGPARDVTIPPGTRVVESSGKYLIPGLWDMHAHFKRPFAPLYLANGVTGVRVMWGHPADHDLRWDRNAGSILAPRMVIASDIFDGPKPVWPGSKAIANEEEARAAVREAKAGGADFIKVYNRLPRPAYFAVIDEAKRLGLTVAGHVPNAITPGEASDAGQRSLEHLSWGWPSVASIETRIHTARDRAQRQALLTQAWRNLDPGKAEALFDRFKRNGTWVCPTLTVERVVGRLGDKDLARDPRLRLIPLRLQERWKPANDPRFQGMGSSDFKFWKRKFAKDQELVGLMAKAGVGLLAGTDAMNPYCFPGSSIHEELALLVGSGLTPLQALQAATLNPARFLGIEKELGTVEVGKRADLVLLDASPLKDIRNTTQIRTVVADGRLLDRGALDAIVARTEAAVARFNQQGGPFPAREGGFDLDLE